jgi:hypothetical protein
MYALAQRIVGQDAASAGEMAAAGEAKRLTLSANVTSAAAKLPYWIGVFPPALI